MTRAAYDVVAVGNAIVDVLAQVDYPFIERHGLVPASMTLIDEERAVALTDLFPNKVIAPGGSAANTMTGVASFGGRAGYMGKVADDRLGAEFTNAFRADGVRYETPPRPGQPATARCLIAVTPDGQRAMNTFLGASTLLDVNDVDRALIESASVLFLEGYLFDRDEAKAAFVHASEIAKGAGRKVSVTLSDVFCVERHRESFRHLVEHHIDILFANENEIINLYQTADLEGALAEARKVCPYVAVTRSEKGSVIAAGETTHVIKPEPVARVLDTTGAGDQYAAGFLFGFATNRPLPECGRLGSVAAAEVISHMGPRPETNLKALAGI
ncbi:MAG: adenosine kinase [Hyphomonadaceae bacterium]|nr:adenosine kinase [Hyphomonadaceae bacterium]